jgi:hypothetical protein
VESAVDEPGRPEGVRRACPQDGGRSVTGLARFEASLSDRRRLARPAERLAPSSEDTGREARRRGAGGKAPGRRGDCSSASGRPCRAPRGTAREDRRPGCSGWRSSDRDHGHDGWYGPDEHLRAFDWIGPAFVGIGLRADDHGRTSGSQTISAKPRAGRTQPGYRRRTCSPPGRATSIRGQPSMTTDSSAVGQWRAEARGRAARRRNPSGRSGRMFHHRLVRVLSTDFPESYSLRSERWRGSKPHGRTLAIDGSASTWRCRVDTGTPVPVGECKARRVNNPIDHSAGGGHGRKDTEVRMERTWVEPPNQNNGYRPWFQTLKVSTTPRGVAPEGADAR